jgi:hypothetical protein
MNECMTDYMMQYSTIRARYLAIYLRTGALDTLAAGSDLMGLPDHSYRKFEYAIMDAQGWEHEFAQVRARRSKLSQLVGWLGW